MLTQVIDEATYRTNAVNFGPVDFPIMAEGDSWFDMSSAITKHNLLLPVQTARSSYIVNFATAGDTLARISQLGTNTFFARELRSPTRFWKALLLSAGGNDLIDAAPRLIQPAQANLSPTDPLAYIDQEALAALLNEIVRGYRRIAALRGGAHAQLPILCHTYDYVTPRNAPAIGLGVKRGPWLYPELLNAKIPHGMYQIVSDHLFNALAQTLLSMANATHANHIPQFFVADTRGVLLPASGSSTGRSNDWLNEIHPLKAAYGKLANARFSPALAKILAH